MEKNDLIYAYILALKAFLLAPQDSVEEELFCSLASDFAKYGHRKGWDSDLAIIERLILIEGA